jgi:hypothetical protein
MPALSQGIKKGDLSPLTGWAGNNERDRIFPFRNVLYQGSAFQWVMLWKRAANDFPVPCLDNGSMRQGIF